MNESATTTRGKPTLIPIPVDGCVLWGRDSIFLDKTGMPDETTLFLAGSFNTRRDRHCFVEFEITFTGIHYLRIMEEDFYFPEPLSEADCEGESTTFGWIEHSRLVDEFRELDSASKMDDKHRQFVFYTYDTVYELVAYDYELVLGKE